MTIFRKNPAFERLLRQEASYTAGLRAAAQPAAQQAEQVAHSIMPRGRGQNITVEVEGSEVAIVNNDYGAHLDEFGSVNNPPYSPLRKGVRAAGLRLEER